MKKPILTFSCCLLVGFLAANAATLRRLPPVAVPEGESIDIETKTATAIRSANTTVVSASNPAEGHALLSGLRLGETELTLSDDKGPFAAMPVRVVPTYWSTLEKFFEDDPEVNLGISGDRIVISGRTANIDTLRRVEQAKAFDAQRIVAQVTYSEAALAVLVQEYIQRCGYTNVIATVVGRDVCLSGRMYDKEAIKQLTTRVKTFLADFPGVNVNSDALRIQKQKILISIEFLTFDLNKTRNLGIKTPDNIVGVLNGSYNWFDSSNAGDAGGGGGAGGNTVIVNNGDSSSGSADAGGGNGRGWNANAGASISGVNVTLNMLKQNGCAKSLYSTSLSTQSGEAARFQNGGTIHRNTQGTFSSDLKEIEYGFIINALPLIVDDNTINLDFELDNKQPDSVETGKDINIKRYQTKSKYVVRPGESIILSGFNNINESITRDGTPFLSRIPIIRWFFSNKATSYNDNEMLLAVTLDWMLEDGSVEARERVQEIKDRKVEVAIP